jgi:hypothetical protein
MSEETKSSPCPYCGRALKPGRTIGRRSSVTCLYCHNYIDWWAGAWRRSSLGSAAAIGGPLAWSLATLGARRRRRKGQTS